MGFFTTCKVKKERLRKSARVAERLSRSKGAGGGSGGVLKTSTTVAGPPMAPSFPRRGVSACAPLRRSLRSLSSAALTPTRL